MDKKYVQFLKVDLRIDKKNEKTSLQHNGVISIFIKLKVLLKVFLYFFEKDLGVFYVIHI
jgi:hypothetical protein